ncbi:hypothetical protein CUMW_094640 [Citrus unshiu]|uniref:EF-hand domain-containing protein n=1 Tax=Citrus unshiu TaxID=55188 RepID=A0A2H5P1J5_CITUN|nr:hypothetical protein CUMW_094640 [Citrus unshiu]
MENTAVLREWFDRVDSEKKGSIAAAQLKHAFAVGNLDFSLSVVQQMIRMYDFDRTGTMSFEEFVELNKFLLKVQHAFSDLERGRGYLVPDNVYEALVKIGFSLDSPAFYTVCESFDQNKPWTDLLAPDASYLLISFCCRSARSAILKLFTCLNPSLHCEVT